jgi:hypothetical protein
MMIHRLLRFEEKTKNQKAMASPPDMKGQAIAF